MIERSRVRVPEGASIEFFSPGSTFCADYYFGIRSVSFRYQFQNICRDKHSFVTTKDMFVATKDMFVATKVSLS